MFRQVKLYTEHDFQRACRIAALGTLGILLSYFVERWDINWSRLPGTLVGSYLGVLFVVILARAFGWLVFLAAQARLVKADLHTLLAEEFDVELYKKYIAKTSYFSRS